MTTTIPNYMTTEEVAAALRTPVETIRYWRSVGKGPRARKIGRRVLYTDTDVVAWLNEQERLDAARGH